MTNKTPEQIEEARRIVAEADAAAARADAENLIAGLTPLTNLGVGTEAAPNINLGQLAAGLREAARSPNLPPTLSNLAFQLSGPLETLHSEVRNKYRQAQEQLIPVPPGQPEQPE